MSTGDIPAAPDAKNFVTDQITLFGIQLNDGGPANIPVDGAKIQISVLELDGSRATPDRRAIIVLYGYAFEGRCYRCDRPKICIFSPETPKSNAAGCGFEDLGYSMWQIAKKTSVFELSTNVDFAEEIILNANLPGNRQPNTYGNSMALAHRSGRLGRGGDT